MLFKSSSAILLLKITLTLILNNFDMMALNMLIYEGFDIIT